MEDAIALLVGALIGLSSIIAWIRAATPRNEEATSKPVDTAPVAVLEPCEVPPSPSSEKLKAEEVPRAAAVEQATQCESDSEIEHSTEDNKTEPGDTVALLIGKKKFQLSRQKLIAYPDTMLGRMFQDSNRPMWEGKGPYRFPERNSTVFESVAQFYATGVLTPPDSTAKTYREYDFWLIVPLLPSGHLLDRILGCESAVPQLVDLLMERLRSHLDAFHVSAYTSRPTVVFVPLQPQNKMLNYSEARRGLPRLLTWAAQNAHRDGVDQCSACGRGDVTHYWGAAAAALEDPSLALGPTYTDAIQVHYKRAQLAQPAQSGGSHDKWLTSAMDTVVDICRMSQLLAGHPQFRHYLRMALARQHIAADIQTIRFKASNGLISSDYVAGELKSKTVHFYDDDLLPDLLKSIVDDAPLVQMLSYVQLTLRLELS